MKLYEITNEYESLFSQIGEDGEMSEDMIQNIESLQADFESKAIAVASYIKNIEAEETAIADAIKLMSARKSTLTKRIESLTEYLQSNLVRLSINEIKSSPYFKIRIKNCPASVDVFDEKLIPAEFLREKITISIDKMKIKEVMIEGVEVPGASIQRKIKLEIK